MNTGEFSDSDVFRSLVNVTASILLNVQSGQQSTDFCSIFCILIVCCQQFSQCSAFPSSMHCSIWSYSGTVMRGHRLIWTALAYQKVLFTCLGPKRCGSSWPLRLVMPLHHDCLHKFIVSWPLRSYLKRPTKHGSQAREWAVVNLCAFKSLNFVEQLRLFFPHDFTSVRRTGLSILLRSAPSAPWNIWNSWLPRRNNVFFLRIT